MKVTLVFSIHLGLLILVQCARNQFETFSDFLEIQRHKQTYDAPDLMIDEFVVHVDSQDGLKAADKISSLPGQPKSEFNQYSGYVTVDPNPSTGRALFYYFVESPNKSSTKPLVLWLNGGPGCSSIGGGAMMELGPFRVNTDRKTLSINKYSWNQVANILFLESPAGVGFSYSKKPSDYKTFGDTQTAKDSYTFLINWFKRFPEYKTRDFFIAGESYAGHYVPQLAELILTSNQNNKNTAINLKGILIGNAYIDEETQETGTHDFWWYHSMISDEIHDGIVKHCNFSWKSVLSDKCNEYIDKEYELVKKLFAYEIYSPLCLNGTSAKTTGFDPCSEGYIKSYLNIPAVQKSLHANLTRPWKACNGELLKGWNDKPFSVLPSIKRVMGSGIRFWLLCGDIDASVPVTATKYGIKKLNPTIKKPWYTCYLNNEVGGFAVVYENLTFVTVRGAGHFIPSYQPDRALTLFSSFLDGKPPAS
ncbi:putative carboxypeptidase D [Helianthus debilis subsp. tardiflorus]